MLVATCSKAWVCGRRLLGLLVWIPLRAWMVVCSECCALSGLCKIPNPCPEKSYTVCVCACAWDRFWSRARKKKKNKRMYLSVWKKKNYTGEIIAKQGPALVIRWGYKYNVAMISTLHSDKIKNVMKRGQSIQKALFVLKIQQTYLRCWTSWYRTIQTSKWALCMQWVQGFFPGSKVLGLTMSGAIPLLPVYACKAWTGTTLLLPLYLPLPLPYANGHTRRLITATFSQEHTHNRKEIKMVCYCITNTWKDEKQHISDPAVKWVCVCHTRKNLWCNVNWYFSFLSLTFNIPSQEK
jgi:hypothetical protein